MAHKQDPDIYQVDANTVRIVFATAPGTDAMRVRVIGFNRVGNEGGDGGVDTSEQYIYRAGWSTEYATDNIHKIGLDGVTIWATQESSTAYEQYESNIYSVATDPTGNLYYAGYSWYHYVGTTATEYNVGSLDAAGTSRWRFLTGNGHSAHGIAAMPNGNVVIYHQAHTPIGATSGTASMSVVDGSDGAVVWQLNSPQTPLQRFPLAVDASNNIYSAGNRTSNVSIWAYTSAGADLWTADSGGAVYALAVDPTQSYLYTAGAVTATANMRRFDLITGAENTAGSWPVLIDASPGAIALDEDGVVYAIGYQASGTSVIHAYNSSGTQLWETVFSGPGDAAWSLVPSLNGKVYVAGNTQLRMFDATTGAESTNGFPVAFGTQQTRTIDLMPGKVGAFPSEWGV